MRFMRHEMWSDALFVHFEVDVAGLQQRLPDGLLVDTHNGKAYVGVVALTEEGIAPWPPGVPLWLVQLLGLSHHAVNVRTYVRPARGSGPPGIYFFSLDCSALLPTVGAKALFNLPYRFARMRRPRFASTTRDSAVRGLESSRHGSEASLRAEWDDDEAGADGDEEDSLGRFLVERYSLYNGSGPLLRWLLRVGQLWGGTITHVPWPLKRARLLAWHSTVLQAAGLGDLVLDAEQKPSVVHCSDGVGPIDFFWRGSVPIRG